MDSSTLDTLLQKTDCPDCGVAPGVAHEEGCDVASCPFCGFQDLQCGSQREEDEHGEGIGPAFCSNTDNQRTDGDMQVWTGVWPGVAECVEFGWWARWTVVTEYSRDGSPDSGELVPCAFEHPHARTDLNRLIIAGATGELVWNPVRSRWVQR